MLYFSYIHSAWRIPSCLPAWQQLVAWGFSIFDICCPDKYAKSFHNRMSLARFQIPHSLARPHNYKARRHFNPKITQFTHTNKRIHTHRHTHNETARGLRNHKNPCKHYLNAPENMLHKKWKNEANKRDRAKEWNSQKSQDKSVKQKSNKWQFNTLNMAFYCSCILQKIQLFVVVAPVPVVIAVVALLSNCYWNNINLQADVCSTLLIWI